MKIWKLATAATAFALSMSANASIISVDWLSAGDNQITLDTVAGLEWLDITATTSRSYSDISSKLGAGQEFDGWRYATTTEISGFWDAFGGDSNHYEGWSTQNNGVFESIASFWGDAYCETTGCNTGDGYLFAINAGVRSENTQYRSKLFDDITDANKATQDFFDLTSGSSLITDTSFKIGHALVRTSSISEVPLPAAVWLFGSGILGLIGVARRKVQL